MITSALAVSAAVLALIYLGVEKFVFSYWKRRGIKQIDGQFPSGSITNFKNATNDVWEMYKKAKHFNWKHFGFYFYRDPIYMPVHLRFVKNITIDNFEYFCDRNNYICEKDILSVNLFGMEGDRWKTMRRKLLPAFSETKLKEMFGIFENCSVKLVAEVGKIVEKHEPINVNNIVARYTTDIIGTSAFGIECNSLEDPNSKFRQNGEAIFRREWRRRVYNLLPGVANYFGFRQFPKSIADFFISTVDKECENRDIHKIEKSDIFQHMFDKYSEGEITKNDIVGQGFLFFLAGFETTSNLICCALVEMAQNETIQEKARTEVTEIWKEQHGLTFDNLKKMTYLDQVIKETLRIHPPVPKILRKCSKDYIFPNSNIGIEKGTSVNISIIGIHHDPTYYQDPETFNPERFGKEHDEDAPKCPFFPFGIGKRACIAKEFGLLQAKVALASLLFYYKFTVSPKTVLPLKFRGTGTVRKLLGDVFLDMQKIA